MLTIRPVRDREAVRAELDVGPDVFLAVLVAKLRPEKRASAFVEHVAAAHSVEPSVQGLVVGEGPDVASVTCAVERSDGAVRMLGFRADAARDNARRRCRVPDERGRGAADVGARGDVSCPAGDSNPSRRCVGGCAGRRNRHLDPARSPEQYVERTRPPAAARQRIAEIGAGVTIRAAVTVAGDEVTIDFDGTDAQIPVNCNAVFAVTLSSAMFVFRMLTDPDAPPNAGCYRSLHVHAPEGSVVHATFPAPTAAGMSRPASGSSTSCSARSPRRFPTGYRRRARER